jgi:bacterioferritin-associated ferredoxin
MRPGRQQGAGWPKAGQRNGRPAAISTLTIEDAGGICPAMLICHCNVITDREIEAVIRAFLAADPWEIIVPAKVYRELGKRGRCCGCFPNVVDIITRVTQIYHAEIAAIAPVENPAPAAATTARRQISGARHERRSAGHRAA